MEEIQRNIHLHLVSEWVCPPKIIRVSSSQLAALQLHRSSVQHWGFSLSLKHNKMPEERGCFVNVDRVPSLFGTPLTAQVTSTFVIMCTLCTFLVCASLPGSFGVRGAAQQHVM